MTVYGSVEGSRNNSIIPSSFSVVVTVDKFYNLYYTEDEGLKVNQLENRQP